MLRSDMNLEHPAITRVRELGMEPMTHEPVCPFCGEPAESFYFDRDGDCVGCCECIEQKSYDEV